jgi:hypothetical protein
MLEIYVDFLGIHNWYFKLHNVAFVGTLRCNGVQFIYGAPLVCYCKDSCRIGKLILIVLLLVPISKTLGGAYLGPTRGTNLCFLYEDQDSTKYVRFG